MWGWLGSHLLEGHYKCGCSLRQTKGGITTLLLMWLVQRAASTVPWAQPWRSLFLQHPTTLRWSQDCWPRHAFRASNFPSQPHRNLVWPGCQSQNVDGSSHDSAAMIQLYSASTVLRFLFSSRLNWVRGDDDRSLESTWADHCRGEELHQRGLLADMARAKWCELVR